MLSSELEYCLNDAFQRAREERHEFITVEHLLLALLDTPAVHRDAQGVRRRSRSAAPRAQGVHRRVDAARCAARKTKGRSAADARFPARAAACRVPRAVERRARKSRRSTCSLRSSARSSRRRSTCSGCRTSRASTSSTSFRTACRRSGRRSPKPSEERRGGRRARRRRRARSSASRHNLNALAEAGKIDPLIGRQLEIERTVQILCRRRKNNPLFVGEAGVGKTALAEGLARLIVEGKVPDVLRSARSTRSTWAR